MTWGIADAEVTPTGAIGWGELKRPPRRGERPGGMTGSRLGGPDEHQG